MFRSVWLSRVGLTLLTTISAGVLGSPAEAASTGVASASGTKITFKAAKGKQNTVVFTLSGRTVTIDDRVAIKAGKGCKAVKGDRTRVRCTTAKTPTRLYAFLNDRNDSLVNKARVRIDADGGTGNDSLTGGVLNDMLNGRSGNDKLRGGAGGDLLMGGYGNDKIWGGAGHDIINGQSGNDAVDGQSGDDRVMGEIGNDHVYGGSGADQISGDVGVDKLYGGAGGDWIDATEWDHASPDYYSGGSGPDWISYASYQVGVVLDADGVKGDDGARGERDTIAADVEDIRGGAGNDVIAGTPGPNFLYGGPGNDTLRGGAGDDDLEGEEGRDRLEGGSGNDELTGDHPYASKFEGDTMLGGSGWDWVDYVLRTTGVVVDLDGAVGDDGQPGEKDTVGADVEQVTGGDGDDRITGNGGRNDLDGRDGDDVIRGGGGNDELHGGNGADALYGEAGNDYLFEPGDRAADRLDGGANTDGCLVPRDEDAVTGCERVEYQ
ncbi:calcium-binding protein [Actinoplanes sp. NPDC023714]|uniref:calcium-binding protein n=1 Tax=Actinoplanes sp. NPDC023714 TaxID=3154322 RepID=UPI0033D6B74C